MIGATASVSASQNRGRPERNGVSIVSGIRVLMPLVRCGHYVVDRGDHNVGLVELNMMATAAGNNLPAIV